MGRGTGSSFLCEYSSNIIKFLRVIRTRPIEPFVSVISRPTVYHYIYNSVGIKCISLTNTHICNCFIKGHGNSEIIGNSEINRSITVIGNAGDLQGIGSCRCIRQNVICCSVGSRGRGSYSIKPSISIIGFSPWHIGIDGDLSIVSPTRSRILITNRIIMCRARCISNSHGSEVRSIWFKSNDECFRCGRTAGRIIKDHYGIYPITGPIISSEIGEGRTIG